MKLADRVVDVHSRGVQSESQFSIQQSSKMFKILSDSLYRDKVMAVIRELSTNAYDAHIAAKNPNPFHVHLPCQNDPNFRVRDFGTGLSKQDMEKLYTTYGASNKHTSNDFVGCLGLGSKSPFAYAKSFTSVSYFNGTQYTYIASIDETGVPVLNLMHTNPTNEPNGLEISFAVHRVDFNDFSQKAMRVFHYFKQKPVIKGGHGIDPYKFSNTNIVLSGDDWKICSINSSQNIFPNQYNKINSSVIAVMGNIAYPVEVSHLLGQNDNVVQTSTNANIQRWNERVKKEDVDSWKTFISSIQQHGFYLEIDFNIGELEMDIGREGLQYTKDVIRVLREKTQDIFNVLKEDISKQIAACKTRIEAIQKFDELNSVYKWNISANWTDPITQKVFVLSSRSDLTYTFGPDKNLYVMNYHTSGRRSRKQIALTNSVYYSTLRKHDGYYSTKMGVKFFYCDIKAMEKAKRVVLEYCRKNNCYGYLLIDAKDYSKSFEGFDSLVQDVGKENFLKVSDYESLVVVNRQPRQKGIKKGAVSDQDVFVLSGDTSDTTKLSVTYGQAHYLHTMTEKRMDKFLNETKIVYIPISRYMSCANFPSLSEISQSYDALKFVFGTTTTIYAIKEKTVSSLTNAGFTMIPINDWLVENIKKSSIKVKDFEDYYGLINHCADSNSGKNADDRFKYNYKSTENQVLVHFASIFGLEYDTYIKNKTLVKMLDMMFLYDFFSKRLSTRFMIKFVDENTYLSHIDKLLNKYKLNKLSAKSILETYLNNNRYIQSVSDLLIKIGDPSKMIDQINKYKHPAKTAYALIDYKIVRETMKQELDKSPAVKYTMVVMENNGSLDSIDTNLKNHLGGRNDWFIKLNVDDSVRKQVASLVN